MHLNSSVLKWDHMTKTLGARLSQLGSCFSSQMEASGRPSLSWGHLQSRLRSFRSYSGYCESELSYGKENLQFSM
jgi:hypothetical protein